ncbi:MAG: XRE family transcriptional regulator [Chloroflexia bacterium]|nr:XRE family transcriptional regulator [Chloroflexia bacterium]
MPEQPSNITEAEGAVALGRRIAAARVAAGMSLRALSARLGVDHSTLAGYEAGRRPLRVNQMIAIARAVGVAPAALLIEPPEAMPLINQIDGNLERVLQLSYIIETLDMPGPDPQP